MSPHPSARQLIDWDHRYLWHPFTQMREWEQQKPLIIERGKGAYLIDTEGKKYLDGTSSIWVNLHGHRHPALDRAIKRQLDKIAHSSLFGLSNPPAIQLARALIRIVPKGLTRVFYSDDGSTAVEIARMCSGVVPQQPPTMLTQPCSANSRIAVDIGPGPKSN